jgi:hypothetical protein
VRAFVPGLLAASLVLFVSCSSECGSSVYPDYSEMNVRRATAYTEMETGPPLQYEELATGSGRTVVLGRKVKLRATFFAASGPSLGTHEASVLFPAFNRSQFDYVPSDIESGEMPVHFGPILGGMQVGTVRRFTMPAAYSPDATWRLQGIGDPSGMEIPAREAVTVKLEVLSTARVPLRARLPAKPA